MIQASTLTNVCVIVGNPQCSSMQKNEQTDIFTPINQGAFSLHVSDWLAAYVIVL